jgi:hypothetical protein
MRGCEARKRGLKAALHCLALRRDRAGCVGGQCEIDSGGDPARSVNIPVTREEEAGIESELQISREGSLAF